MSATVLYMSMTLDGFIAGPNESFDNGLGDGGERNPEQIGLERTRILEGEGGVTHMHYRVGN